MEKKTLPYKNILITGLYSPIHGGSQALYHTAQQKKDLVSGKYFLRTDPDFSKLFIHRTIYLN